MSDKFEVKVLKKNKIITHFFHAIFQNLMWDIYIKPTFVLLTYKTYKVKLSIVACLQFNSLAFALVVQQTFGKEFNSLGRETIAS